MKRPFALTSRIENAVNPEDLALIPGSNWVVATSMADISGRRGCLYAIDASTRRCCMLYGADDFDRDGPKADAKVAYGPEVYAPGFTPHGLALGPGEDMRSHALYVVNHYPFDSVEVFLLRLGAGGPSVAWVESLRLPAGACGNDVVVLPEGGLALTNMLDPRDTQTLAKMEAGSPTGCVLEWRRDRGWTSAPGSALSGPNGVEVSPDGEFLFVSSWSSANSVVRLPRAAPTAPRVATRTGVLGDNLAWASDGLLIATGQCACPIAFAAETRAATHLRTPFATYKIDPATMEIAETLILHDGRDGFGAGTVAIEVGKELWVGSSRSSTIACFSRTE
jgi:hypothetical protein